MARRRHLGADDKQDGGGDAGERRRIGGDHHRRRVDDDPVIPVSNRRERVAELVPVEQIAGIVRRVAGGDNRQAVDVGGRDRVDHAHRAVEDTRQARRQRRFEDVVHLAAAHVGVDEKHLAAGRRQGDRHVCCDDRLAFARSGAGDQQHVVVFGRRGDEQVGADGPQRFGKFRRGPVVDQRPSRLGFRSRHGRREAEELEAEAHLDLVGRLHAIVEIVDAEGRAHAERQAEEEREHQYQRRIG